jgi:quercetin dioxygenase-like cupin family protein/DNA-binding XRE family transcriptional regulator
MRASPLPSLGERIRAERTRQGVSLRALARDVGVSPSMISQIETGKARPSVSTLYSITNRLRISLHDLFAAEESVPDLTPVAAARRELIGPLTVVSALGLGRGTRLGPHIRPDQRQILSLDAGVTWERLGELPPVAVDFLRVIYAPGAASSGSGEMTRHNGWEFAFLLRGELTLTLRANEIIVRPGDAISFDSNTPHRFRNDGTESAVGIWFVVENVDD